VILKNQPKRSPRTAPEASRSSRDSILEAALKAFAREGFEGASMPKVARMAQVAPPLIHYYFGAKDNLWRETVDHSLGQLCRQAVSILEATRALAPLDRLRAILQAYTLFAARHPDQFVMIMAEAQSDSDRFAWVQENYTRTLLGGVKSNLDEAISQKVVKPIDTSRMTMMMVGSILLYFTISPPAMTERDLENIANEYTEFLFDTYLNGIATR
jgi:TetR/AcrR family transcriptional regulator